MFAPTIIVTTAGIIPYEVPGRCQLINAQANTQVVLSNRPDATYADWQSGGALADGAYDGNYGELGGFTWPTGVKFDFWPGEIIFLAAGGSGSIHLYFDVSPEP